MRWVIRKSSFEPPLALPPATAPPAPGPCVLASTSPGESPGTRKGIALRAAARKAAAQTAASTARPTLVASATRRHACTAQTMAASPAPRMATCAALSARLRFATAVKVQYSFCKRAMVLGWKSFGNLAWKTPSRMSGRMKVTKPRAPGRSRPLDMRTSAAASGARLREKATRALRSCAASCLSARPRSLSPATLAAVRAPTAAPSRASPRTTTSSKAELAPRPK
mmetsp:Transcript_9416/g.27467  ORF Transcript_9416/g.27467 Transcript_9416/m.27467 type:complete len:225 (+) Transcript_9416:468-1142(+)